MHHTPPIAKNSLVAYSFLRGGQRAAGEEKCNRKIHALVHLEVGLGVRSPVQGRLFGAHSGDIMRVGGVGIGLRGLIGLGVLVLSAFVSS